MDELAKPRLREDLEQRALEDDSFELRDPVTNRVWRFDELQIDVLNFFDGETSLKEIGDELGTSDGQSAVLQLARNADDLGLLTSAKPMSPRLLGAKQAAAMRGRMRVLRDARVAASVRWARDNLDFYAESLGTLADTVHSAKDLNSLPVTTKADIRENFPDRLIVRGADLQALVEDGEVMLSTTSGSTGGRMQYVFDLNRSIKQSLARHPAFANTASENSVKSVTFTTPICNGQLCHRGGIPFEERMLTDSVLQLNSSERIMRLEKSHLEEIVADMKAHDAQQMAVDPVYAAALVLAFRKYEMELPKITLLSTGWEYLTIRHREILTEAFGVEIYPTYGATDIGGGAAIWCENRRFHVMDDDFVFEYLRNGEPVEFGEFGEVLVTSLRHSYTRHIRYRVGDVARPIATCGCSFDDWPCFEFEGRVQDLLEATDGSVVTSRAVDDLFKGIHWADFYQLIEKSAGQYQLLVVPSEGADKTQGEAEYLKRLRTLLGDDAVIRVQYVRELPIEQSFKYPPTKRKNPQALRQWSTK
jgi:phenylacetate-CoA ligase